MRIDCVERRFALLFAHYVRYVVACPYPFIVVPFLLTLVLSSGLLRHSEAFMKDELELYTPTDAKARDELRHLDDLFHINDTDPFYATRRYDIRRAGYIIVTGERDGADILNPLVMHAAMQLWTMIQSQTVEDAASKRVTYPSLCVKFPMPPELGRALGVFLAPNNMSSPDNICVSNPLVEAFKFVILSDQSVLDKSIDDIILGQISESFTIDSVGMAHLLGGVTLDSEKRIAGAKAIMLPYALRHSTKDEDELAEKWELMLANFLIDFHSPFIKTSWWTYETLASESARDREQLIRMLGPCFGVVSVYTIVMCCVISWTRSRPLLAIGGVISAAMAIVSGVGLLLLFGFKITSVAYSMPFIVFSVGVDNVFILLSAWRSTNYELTLVERMMETFGDAAVSITVTSLTDLISFGVGCMTPFPSVQMFCAYAVVAVVFTYVYQLTFFAGVMVLTCKREVENRHCLFFYKIEKNNQKIEPEGKREKRRKEAASSKYWTIDSVDQGRKKKCVDRSFEKNHYLAKFFKTTYSELLLNPFVRLAIICGFLFYFGVATYGCINIKLGLEPNDLLPDNSYGKRTLMLSEKYFSEYGSYLHVWMYNLSRVDLGHRRIWNVLEREIELYEHTEFTGYSDSWLRTFLAFVKQSGLLITQENFVYILRNVFLSQPQFAKYNRDIMFDVTGSYLDASRVPVHLRFVGANNQSRAMHLFRRLAETSDLPTGVYADFFQFAEQYNAVLPGTLSSIGIAGAAVIVVSLVLIPEPIASLWVCFSIVSINVGILGFMTFWGVSLDFISMVTIVMSIGFCVDFAAHLAYNFAKGLNLTSAERVRNALYAVGTPILQSASSTILGVSFMAFTESYVFRSFLKTIILVISLGALHGLVILPVLLTIFHCNGNEEDSKDSEQDSEEATTSSSLPPFDLDKIMHNSRLPRVGVSGERPPPYYENRHHAINTYLESVACPGPSYSKKGEKSAALMNGALSRKTAAFSRSLTNLKQDVDKAANTEYAECGNVRPLKKSDRSQSQWSFNPAEDLVYHNPVNDR
ncbi:hypothetical protein QR680_013732 [Steinernema hermaphroditum]|uniref:SSD domain-containing protein n=1 Tax=Steinernema hermaphroditum TaxID=289476 RepID=A0AA39M2Z8_9BILA|nr:hypothetical protein QR680_013732 [Steinernema hermaphroditum]